MKRHTHHMVMALLFGCLTIGAAQAQSMNKQDGDKKAATPGATGGGGADVPSG